MLTRQILTEGLPAKFRTKFRDRLRKAKQCRGRLRDGKAFCLAGLLLDVIAPEWWEGNLYQAEGTLWETYHPDEPFLSAGITLELVQALTKANDSRMTFKEVADLL